MLNRIRAVCSGHYSTSRRIRLLTGHGLIRHVLLKNLAGDRTTGRARSTPGSRWTRCLGSGDAAGSRNQPGLANVGRETEAATHDGQHTFAEPDIQRTRYLTREFAGLARAGTYSRFTQAPRLTTVRGSSEIPVCVLALTSRTPRRLDRGLRPTGSRGHAVLGAARSASSRVERHSGPTS